MQKQRVKTSMSAVSYTHLDVYKRQVDDNALRFFGPGRYHSDEFQDEAYLFIPFDEDYYQAMAEVILSLIHIWLDYSMRLHWFEDMDEDENRSYDMEEPNFFGLSIAYDP